LIRRAPPEYHGIAAGLHFCFEFRFAVNLDELSDDERAHVWTMLRQWQQQSGTATSGPPVESIDFLERLLGPSVCRRLGIYRLPENFLLSVVMPVFNERHTIDEIIRRVRACGIPCELVIVDDGSTDGTRELLEKYRGYADVTLLFHAKNEGKGAALRKGFLRAKGDVVVVQDADLEYDPADYSRLLQPIIEDQADVVYGSRFSGGSHRVLYFWHSAGNRFLTLISNVFTNLNLTDIETCYKMFRRELIQQIAPTLREPRFGIEPELTAKLARVPGVRIYERPINYSGRTYAQGKKIGWRDGLRALWCILRY
jgi:glycosyltransferase involved in cell wall biosynthesis